MYSLLFKVFAILLALANVSYSFTTVTPVSFKTIKDISIPFEDANEKTLLEFGKKSNSPLLKLIGFALKNLKCELKGPCDNWSPWTRCSSVPQGTFGLRTRMHSCYQSHSDECDNLGGTKTVENQNEVCEGFAPNGSDHTRERICPQNYNITSTHLCLKINKAAMKYDAAEQFCEEDGGHIINIDSRERFEAASSVANTSYMWVQGKRTQQAGPWQYTVGGDPESQPFFKWDQGDPDNGASDLYMVFYQSEFYDTPDSTYKVICEIRQ